MSRPNQNQNYLGNPNIKKDGITQNWTKEEVQEYALCMKDPVYFIEKYAKIISLDVGLVPFQLYPYQKKMFQQFEKNRFNVVLACRQSGKSISACGYLLWFALFQPEKSIAILANKGATAREMLARITIMLENIPFFLQPGVKALNKSNIDFSNNSRIIAAATTGQSIRGLSINLLYLDEFAFVERAAEFYTSTYPVISSGTDTKIIVTSTANGIGNTFHKIWEGSIQGVNEYSNFRVDWNDVPGRDEKWKQETINNTSQVQFDQEFGNTFFGTGNTLINAQTLLDLRASQPVKIMENGDMFVYKETVNKHDYILVADVAKGRGQDYSTFSLIDISTRPFEQVAVYRNNTISPLLFPNIIYKYANVYNKAYCIIESNDQGSVVCNGLYYDLEYENVHVESAIKANAVGIEINRKSKRLGCSALKDLMENNKIKVVDEQTILEISTFEAKGQTFEASTGNHDDLVMNLVLFGYFVSSAYFANLTDINIKDMIFKQKLKAIEEDIVPFGFIDDGSEQIEKLQNEESEDPMRRQWQISYDREL
tara:strand:- start:174 stop:1793 length:1620 start_codon:yes stop_codon:yes gene_type:complete